MSVYYNLVYIYDMYISAHDVYYISLEKHPLSPCSCEFSSSCKGSSPSTFLHRDCLNLTRKPCRVLSSELYVEWVPSTAIDKCESITNYGRTDRNASPYLEKEVDKPVWRSLRE